MGVDELNGAIIAQMHRSDGAKLDRGEREQVARFRDLYRDVSEIGKRPEVKRALIDVLEDDLSFLTEVPNNPLLTEHLRELRASGRVLTLDGVRTIQQLAKRLSDKEDEAISATLTSLALRDAIAPEAMHAVTQYLDTERINRADHARAKKRSGTLLAAGVVIATVVGVPLLFWLTPVGAAAVAKLGVAAAKGVQLGALFGAIAGGLGLGAWIKRSTNRSANSYGETD